MQTGEASAFYRGGMCSGVASVRPLLMPYWKSERNRGQSGIGVILLFHSYLLRTSQGLPVKGPATNQNQGEPIQTNHCYLTFLHKQINQHKSDDCRIYRSQKSDATDNTRSIYRRILGKRGHSTFPFGPSESSDD